MNKSVWTAWLTVQSYSLYTVDAKKQIGILKYGSTELELKNRRITSILCNYCVSVVGKAKSGES